VLLAGAWGALHVGPLDDYEIVDLGVYEEYGDAMVDGQVPYRDFDLEYPPGALPAFLVPSLAPESEYREFFEAAMLLCGLAVLAALAYALSAAGRPAREVYGAVAVAGIAALALGPVILTRFDLWPAALLAAALAALAADRSRLGLGLLAAAASAKIYPLIVLPLALVYVGRRHGRRAALWAFGAFAAVLAVIVAPFAILAPGGLLESLTEQAGRPLQVESLAASALYVGKQLELYETRVETSFGSQNLDGSLPDVLASLSTGLQVVAVAAVWLAFSRGDSTRARLFVASAGVVTAFVAFGKVLSPQFMIWLLALVPFTTSLAPLALMLSALVLTHVYFPERYWDYQDGGGEAWVVLGRNAVLAALVVLLLRRLSRPAPEAPRTP
jgi:hypothetical protein